MTPMDEFAETDEWPVPERWAWHQAETGLTPPAPPSPATDRVVWRDRGVRIATLEAEVAILTREIFDRDATEVDARSRLTVAETELSGLRAEVERLTGSLEIALGRLTETGHPEDLNRFARLHIEAALEGHSRPLVLANMRAEAAEAELREGIRAMADSWDQFTEADWFDHTPRTHADHLRALLSGEPEECPYCDGRGIVDSAAHRCGWCGGTGRALLAPSPAARLCATHGNSPWPLAESRCEAGDPWDDGLACSPAATTGEADTDHERRVMALVEGVARISWEHGNGAGLDGHVGEDYSESYGPTDPEATQVRERHVTNIAEGFRRAVFGDKTDVPVATNDVSPLGTHRESQRERDNRPCPKCGGDRLRPNFTGTSRCHAPHPVPAATTGEAGRCRSCGFTEDRHGKSGEWCLGFEPRQENWPAPVSSGEAGEGEAWPLSRDEQRRLDNEPCPKCGGDRLRPNFTGSDACHAKRRPAPVVAPSAEGSET